MLIKSVSDFRAAIRQGAYADGGYPLVFICADGEPLCPKCAKTERRPILEAIKNRRRSDQWRVDALEIHYEGDPLCCCHCGARVESAYGRVEPDCLTVEGRKVIVSREGVAAFNKSWPCSELRDRSYWFEFDGSDLVDTDLPQHDDGAAAKAMADDCLAYLDDETQAEWMS